MKRNITNYAFYALASLSLLAVLITFIVFNRPVKSNELMSSVEYKQVKASLAECKIDRNEVYVAGWAFQVDDKNEKYLGNNKVVIRSGDDFYSLKTQRTLRRDVSSHYKKPGMYDMSGFSAASLTSFFGLHPENEIYIITENNGKIRGAKYACNQ